MSEAKTYEKFGEKVLSSNQEKALNLLIYEGLTQTETAERLHVSLNTVNNWVNRDEAFQGRFNEEIEKQAKKVQARFKLKVNRAVGILIDLAEHSKNDMVRLNAVKEILSRAESGSSLEDKRLLAQIEKIKAETNAIKGAPSTDEPTPFERFEQGLKAGGANDAQ